MTGPFQAFGLLPASAFSMWSLTCASMTGPLSFAIAASAARSKKTISTGKPRGSGKNTPRPKSSATSDPASTSSAKGFGPYWSDSCAETNSRLWLPIATGSPDSDLNSSDSSLMRMAGKSWFSIKAWTPGQKPNSPPICSPSFTTSLAGCTGSAAPKTAIRAKKIRIYPSATQKSLFGQWFGTSRHVYNKTVEHLNLPKEEREKHWMGAAKSILAGLPAWAAPVPYQVKKIAVEDAYKAFSNGCRKAKATGKPFGLKYRSRKDPRQSCYVPKSALKAAGIYPRLAGGLRMAEGYPGEALDSRLVREHGRWFLMVPYRVAVAKAESQGRAVAIDPGVRTFATCFAEGLAAKIGEGDFARVARLGWAMDHLISRMSKAKCRRRQRMRKALARMKWKIWDLIDELHFKAINLLVSSYDIVILPEGGTASMVAKSTRRIRSKTVRSMLTYAFSRFALRLESKAAEMGKAVVRCSEAWTSKTASWTGEIKNIGSAKSIVSKGVRVDRDINGARGIFLRALGDTPLLKASSMHLSASAAL